MSLTEILQELPKLKTEERDTILHRIEELTDRSLSRPTDLAELCLAFEVERRLP